MKNKIFIAVLLTILSFKSYSQIVFENGYFINESDQKIDCLIKNNDWKNNPIEFKYKTSNIDSIQSAAIQTIKEFGINGVFKYIRAEVEIDRSSDDLNYMSTEKNPIFKKELLFLKVLIEGKASLYIYKDNNITRFFYKTNDSKISQLVYKSYLVNRTTTAQNNFFRQQLFLDLKCQGKAPDNVEYVKYHKKELENSFLNYNKCINSEFVNYESKQKRDLFNLSFRLGLNSSSLAVHHSDFDSWNVDLGSKISFRFGVEAEFILPYNRNKWAIIIEPTFQNFKKETTKEASDVSGGTLTSIVNYPSIELPIGIRHYLFLNDNSKLFINASYVMVFDNSSTIEFNRNDGSNLKSIDIKSRGNLSFGIGYKYKDKFSIEMRNQTNREILNTQPNWSSDFKTNSIILGYTIF